MAPMAATALAAVAVTALAAASVAGAPARVGGAGDSAGSTARMWAALPDAKVITLADDCDDDCQTSVSAALSARGCSGVAVLPTLRMVTARCARTEGAASDSVNAETARIPGVLEVEDDSLVTGTQVDEGDREGDLVIPITDGSGKPYFWGLDRINQYQLPLDMNRQMQCYPAKGDGVDVFVVDSGCAVNHPEFADTKIRTMALPSSPFSPEGIDDRGHGSHVAGTVAGKTTGVAPGAQVTCIKVLNENGSGKSSDVAAGFEHVAAYKKANPAAKVIMQASLGGSGNHHNTVMRRMAAVGVIGSVAAGNDGGDACDHTPAGSPHVITAGNMDIDDSVWRNSNIGRCVDVFAPGHKTLSVDFRSNGLTTKTGTSMSSPHVAGLIALILSNHPDGASLDVNAVKALLTAGAPMITDHPMAWVSPACNGSAPAPAVPAPGPVPLPTGPPAPKGPSPDVPPPAPTGPAPGPGGPAPPCPVVPAPGTPGAPAPWQPAPTPPTGPAPVPPPPAMYPGGIPPEGSTELPQMPLQ